MGFRDDRRGQAIQVGAVLLFAVLIIAFSSYQAVIVPADNRRVEFNHNQEVQDQLAELRNAFTSMTASDGTRSVGVALGTQYPSRTLGLNPPSPSGSLRTVGTTDPLVNLSIRNATADGETGDLWNGTVRHYNSGALGYSPLYHQYDEAPETIYEHSVLYNQFDEATLVLANQTLVSGNRISPIALNGSLDRTAGASTTVDVQPISSSSETILIEANGSDSPISLNFTSRLSEDRWRSILSDEENVENVTARPSAAGEEFTAIRVTLNHTVEYRLQMTKAAVGQGATGTDPAYITTISGDEATVSQGSQHEVTLAVRDRYDNPIAGVDVDSSLPGDSKTTGGDGRVTFTYDSTDGAEGSHRINFTFDPDTNPSSSSFEPRSTENATVDVNVSGSAAGGGSGAYTLNWTSPVNESANGDEFGDCDAETCIWDVSSGSDDALVLNASLSLPFQGVGVSFVGDDTTVGSISPANATTDGNGVATTTLTANDDGTIDVLASADDGSDVITVEVTNVTEDGPTGQVLQPVEVRDTTENRLVFRIENSGAEQVTVEQFSIDIDVGPSNTVLDDGNGAELEILRASTQNGEANRNGNPTAFEVDGTRYDLDADSNQGNSGAYAAIEPQDDTVDVDLREFQPGIGSELVLVETETEADVVVELILSDGSVQEFYFEAA